MLRIYRSIEPRSTRFSQAHLPRKKINNNNPSGSSKEKPQNFLFLFIFFLYFTWNLYLALRAWGQIGSGWWQWRSVPPTYPSVQIRSARSTGPAQSCTTSVQTSDRIRPHLRIEALGLTWLTRSLGALHLVLCSHMSTLQNLLVLEEDLDCQRRRSQVVDPSSSSLICHVLLLRDKGNLKNQKNLTLISVSVKFRYKEI